MPENRNNLQNQFLERIQKSGQLVTVYLSSGTRLSGRVSGYDNFSFLLNSGGGEILIYKHAVATIAPQNQNKPKPKPREDQKQPVQKSSAPKGRDFAAGEEELRIPLSEAIRNSEE